MNKTVLAFFALKTKVLRISHSSGERYKYMSSGDTSVKKNKAR